MNYKTWVGLSVLAAGILSILPVFYLLSDEPGMGFHDDPFVDYIFMWGSPIRFRVPMLSDVLTMLATLLLCLCALIFVISGRALNALAFLCSLMFASQGGRSFMGILNFILLPERTVHGLVQLVPPMLMTAIAYSVLRIFQRAWDAQVPASGGSFVATPLVRFYGYAVDLAIIKTLLMGAYSPDMLLYEWLAALVLYVLYYAVFERLFLFTPGKLLLNTRVSMRNDAVPPEGTIVLRTVARLIPFEPLSCLYNEGWHDTLSKTKVVRYPWGGGLVTTG